MAHPKEKRAQLRAAYIFERLPMEAACAKVKVPVASGKRWKYDAKANGDDWDEARSAVALGDESFAHLARRLLHDYLLQHEATIASLKADPGIKPAEKAEIIARLTDALNKMMAALKRVSPELNKHAIALDVLQRLANFTQRSFPKDVPVLLEILEPFGEELAKAYA